MIKIAQTREEKRENILYWEKIEILLNRLEMNMMMLPKMLIMINL